MVLPFIFNHHFSLRNKICGISCLLVYGRNRQPIPDFHLFVTGRVSLAGPFPEHGRDRITFYMSILKIIHKITNIFH